MANKDRPSRQQKRNPRLFRELAEDATPQEKEPPKKPRPEVKAKPEDEAAIREVERMMFGPPKKGEPR